MAQSDARFGYRARLGRTDHDLNQPFGFTCPPGMLCPIWFDFATPGDSYYMKHDLPILRSIQLLSPMMTDVKVHFETFFVPIQMLYQPAENALTKIANLQSSSYGQSIVVEGMDFPLFNFDEYLHVMQDVSLVDSYFADIYRMIEFFGLGSYNYRGFDESLPPVPNMANYLPSFFPWQILAYHTIFEYYYRLDDKSQFANDNCNWDKFMGSSVATLPNADFMQLHQRPWDFDYFTSMYRSPLVSNANMQSLLPGKAYSSLSAAWEFPLDISSHVSTLNRDITSFGINPAGTGNGELNSVVIRTLFANEKLAMITGRARKNYDSQILAHYGVDVPHDVKHDITMIHHDTYDLNVMEVTSLASTSDAPLGELAGKSFSHGNGKEFKFTAPVHGVVMTIFSIEPKRRYLTGFDRINSVVSTEDLPIPEYDRLGNVPMFRYETCPLNGATMSNIIGWKERYYQFKRKMPKVTMAFYTANGKNNYSSFLINTVPFGTVTGTDTSVYSSTLSRPDAENRFYIDRRSMDSQCALQWIGSWQHDDDGENWFKTPWLVYARDPFIVDSHIKCKKVSWMSKDGEPIYD